MSALPFLLALLLLFYWLCPIVVWMTQKWSVHPEFEPFDPTRHPLDQHLLTAFRQTRDALVGDRFAMVADLVSTRRRLRTRVAMFEDGAKEDVALAVAMQSVGTARVATCYVELPVKFRDGRTRLVRRH